MNRKLSLILAVILSFCFLGLAPGDVAPSFSAKNQDGKLIQSSELKGKYVLIFFYPKDDTPGCTKEACRFRDEYSQLKKRNVVIFGVSTQDEKSHQEFRRKHHLPFDLLVDSEGSLSRSFGVGKMTLMGLYKRQSILISPEGKVIKFYEEVDPATHVEEVLKDLQ